MVKVVELEQCVPDWTAQDLFELVYGDSDAVLLRAFHAELNGDPAARVGPWEGDARTLSFSAPVDAPAFIKRLVGADRMRVEETQTRGALPGGAGWQLASLPVPDMPGGAKFATQAVFRFTDAPGGGCQVLATITCSAAGPYGLTGAIETFMAEASKKSLGEFLGFVAAFAARQRQRQQKPAAVAAPEPAIPVAVAAVATTAAAAAAAAIPAATPAAAAAAEAEQFFDAVELPPLPLPLPAAAAAAAAPFPAIGEGLRAEDSALLYMRYLCRTGDQTVGLLQALSEQVRSLEASLAALQAAEEERRRARRWLPELPGTVSTRQALLFAGLLASSTAGLMLLVVGRRQQRHVALAG